MQLLRYSAPPVSYPVGRSRFLALGLMAWSVAAVGIIGLFVHDQAPLTQYVSASSLFLLAALLGVTVALFSCWRVRQFGWLTWLPVHVGRNADPTMHKAAHGRWYWSALNADVPVALDAPVVVVDLGNHLAIRLSSHEFLKESTKIGRMRQLGKPHPTWVWLERRAQPDRWLAVRRALWVQPSQT